eukprot:TRINITY_DN9507_c0_g1_i4.p1 TRINITY_DN9507_c0_g1~~TRINITY_DN9507_c0_g1_i4.p1  ORF type:complete len:327 (-),score=51.21 TRINITY_DN9507_c0_g1_i4:131-1111(-)
MALSRHYFKNAAATSSYALNRTTTQGGDYGFEGLESEIFKQRQRIVLTHKRGQRLSIFSQESKRISSQNDYLGKSRPESKLYQRSNNFPLNCMNKGLRVLTRQRPLAEAYESRNNNKKGYFSTPGKHSSLDGKVQKNDIKLLSSAYSIPIPAVKSFNPHFFTSVVKFRRLLKPVAKRVHNIKKDPKPIFLAKPSNVSNLQEKNDKLRDSLISFGESINNSKEELEDCSKVSKGRPYALVANEIKPMFFFNVRKRAGDENKEKTGSEANTPSFLQSCKITLDPQKKEDTGKEYGEKLENCVLLNRTTIFSNAVRHAESYIESNHIDL